jgi:RIO-like serine/threonine protein kinase
MSNKQSEFEQRAQEFLDEVRAVCRKHGMQLTVSGYDGLLVWTLQEGDEELYANGIEVMK